MRWALAATAFLTACAAPVPPSSEDCAGCHVNQYEQWRSSHHASSGVEPAFLALLPRVEAAQGTLARARCETCHSPGLGDAHGIGCPSCHLATGNRGTQNGALVVDLDGPVATAHDVKAPHPTRQGGFLRASELCGTCHEVHGPGALDEPTFTEFQATNPPAEVTCAGCHLVDHRMVGLSEATLAQALELRWTSREVTVRNVGARHRVPTGMTALRQVWVEVTVDGGVVRVLDLGAEVRPGPSFVDADAITPRGLQFGEARSWTSDGVITGAVLRFSR